MSFGCPAGTHAPRCTEGCVEACKKLMRGERIKPTFDEWFKWGHGATFDELYMQNTMSIPVALKALARALRDYATEMAR